MAFNVYFEELSENTQGCDWVVGDIHGAFELLDIALAFIEFNPAYDRLICCGDWVDRGATSGRVLEYLRKDWVYSVRGNHEHEWLSRYVECSPTSKDYERMQRTYGLDGGGWFRGLSQMEREEFFALIEPLPYALEFMSPMGRIGVLHAEVPLSCSSWIQLKSRLIDQDECCIESVLWGRNRVTQRINQPVKEVDWICAGHTTLPYGVEVFGNMIDLDSGAIWQQEHYSNYAGLTLFDTRIGRFHQIGLKPDAPQQVSQRLHNHYRYDVFSAAPW